MRAEREPWRQPGDERTLNRYVRQRQLPTQAMQGLTDGLLKLFADSRGPVKTCAMPACLWFNA